MNVMNNNKVLCPVRALLDSGFQIRFITEIMCKRFNIELKDVSFSAVALNENV